MVVLGLGNDLMSAYSHLNPLEVLGDPMGGFFLMTNGAISGAMRMALGSLLSLPPDGVRTEEGVSGPLAFAGISMK